MTGEMNRHRLDEKGNAFQFPTPQVLWKRTGTVKTGFHYPSWRPELTARVDGWPVSITRQHGPCWRARVSTSQVDGPCWRFGSARTDGAQTENTVPPDCLLYPTQSIGVIYEGYEGYRYHHFLDWGTIPPLFRTQMKNLQPERRSAKIKLH